MNHFKFLWCFALIVVYSGWAQAKNISWEVTGASAGVAIILKDAPNPNTKAIFFVNFAQERGCQPEVALLVHHNADTGAFESRQTSKRNMYVIVGNKQIYGNVIATKYKNGIEFGFFSNEDQIKILSGNGSVSVKYLEDMQPFIFPLDNARSAISKARKNCFK